MKVLITGGAGFLGSHLAQSHLGDGDDVWAIDTAPNLKVRHLLQNPGFHYVKASVLDEGQMEAFVLRADLIYHHAAVVGVEHYVDDPLTVLNVNIQGTVTMLKLCHRHQKRIVLASTSEVYGRNPEVPWSEESDRVLGPPTVDRWCYSTSKAAAEHYLWAYRRIGLKGSVVRYFNVYGPRLDKIDAGRVLTIFMGQILRGEPLTIIGDGQQTRCFTYVDDAIRATKEAASPYAEGMAFNIGTDRETTILELAQTMLRSSGKDPGMIKFVKPEEIYGKSYQDIPRRVPNVRLMRERLRVTADTPLEVGLRRTIDWFLSQAQVHPSLTSVAVR